VFAGIFISRIFGLVRTRFLAAALGRSIATDAWVYAFRIPNMLQTMLGEGVLSASFIPVYARLVRDGDEEEAGRTAGAVFAALALVVSIMVLLGVVFAPALTSAIASGLSAPGKEETRRLTIQLTRILFPSAGIAVMSTWCLGILNSHRRYFLSYVSPVFWNLAMITVLVVYRHDPRLDHITVMVAWASVAGTTLQFLVQLPVVLRLARRLRIRLDFRRPSVRTILRNFVPALLGRGVNTLSGLIDLAIASFLPSTMAGLLGYAQNLYMLPVSLFGMSVSAAELAEMSHTSENEGPEAYAAMLRRRMDAGLRQIAFLVVPSAMAFFALGGVIVALIFQTGRFDRAATQLTWSIVAGSGVGLLASTLSRLYSSTYYVLQDTRTPLKFAGIRVVLTTILGWFFAIEGPRLLGIDAKWGAAGLTASAGLAAWVEFTLLRTTMNRRIGTTGLHAWFVARLWICAGVSAAAAWGVKLALPGQHPLVYGALIVGVYGTLYFALTSAARIPESQRIVRRVLQRA
jgi:putative peptidoglycan lipid II flippase